MLPSSGAVTFLFTDLEGQTRLWEEHPDAMPAALARHDALLREAVLAHRGRVVKGTGDGLHAVFARASDAVAAAVAGQRALHAEAWALPIPLRARMGLHTGDSEERDGDYFGPTVNRAVRIMAAGHGGQILLSQVTADLLRDEVPDSALRDLGQHRLRDLGRPEHLFQLEVPDLPVDFAPLRALDRRQHNLPVEATALIGREATLASVRARLLRPDVRLLTLTGPGGTGKTRLALQVAAGLVTDFADGVWLVALAPLNDPTLVAATVAHALGLRDGGDRPPAELVREYLLGRQALLLFDNFEHLLAAAGLVADLLAACPRLKVLATSREPLHLYGEHELAVPPLAVPPLDASAGGTGALRAVESVRLFVERAQAARSDFALSAENAAAVVQICRRLDGLPLAIELAAARVRILPPEQIAARLEDGLGLLAGGARDRPPRQRTLRDAIAWSHDLLDAPERELFRRLGVFRGGFGLEAVEAVCGEDLLDGLASLVDKSLVRRDETAGGAARFAMLETIREFALERLEEAGELDVYRQRHADYVVALGERAEPGLCGADQIAWLDRLGLEIGNLRAALGYLLAEDEPAERARVEAALALVGAVASFFRVRGHVAEGLDWLDRALRAGRAPTPARLRALLGAAWILQLRNDSARARPLIDEAVALAEELGSGGGVAFARHLLGRAAYVDGDLAAAKEYGQCSLARARDVGDRWVEGYALQLLGRVADLGGDFAAAGWLYEQSLVVRREIGYPEGTLMSLELLGVLAYRRGDRAEARRWLGEARRLLEPLDHVHLSSVALAIASNIAAAEGQPERAIRLAAAADRMVSRANAPLIPDVAAATAAHLAAIRASLPEQTYKDLWAAGRALALDEALDEALAPA